MKTKIIIALLAMVLAGTTATALAVDPNDLVYITEVYPPYNFTERGRPTGVSVELLRLMWEKMGASQQPIHVYPWARGYHLAQTKPNHVLFATSRTKERENLFKWVGPLYVTRLVLLGLSERNLSVPSLEDAKTYRIGTIKEDIAEQLLVTAGFDKDKLQGMPRMEMNIEKLRRGRIDLIAGSERGLYHFIKTRNLDARQFETVCTIEEKSSYYAFHKDTPDALIRQFQQAFDSLETQRQEILAKFFGY